MDEPFVIGIDFHDCRELFPEEGIPADKTKPLLGENRFVGA
jgi:hypothetical protein